jgi:hypothetical protein
MRREDHPPEHVHGDASPVARDVVIVLELAQSGAASTHGSSRSHRLVTSDCSEILNMSWICEVSDD